MARHHHKPTAEDLRMAEAASRAQNWKRWGPYLSERQWGTVREDYSPGGDAWTYFPHDQARSRAYRWGEDGLLGVCDRQCRLCFALALWNHHDPILKERLFGVTGPEGNHGEDVKEEYFYLDATPTASYLKALYKYPRTEYPYARLVRENQNRSRTEREFELVDTGVFAANDYFDVVAEYAKAGPDDVLIRITVTNRGAGPAKLELLPTFWYRNSWVWGCTHEGCEIKPRMERTGPGRAAGSHVSLGRTLFAADLGQDGKVPSLLFTDNETNPRRIFGKTEGPRYAKDAFHDFIVEGKTAAINPRQFGTKLAPRYSLELAEGESFTARLRFWNEAAAADEPLAPPVDEPFGPAFEEIFAERIREAQEFYDARMPASLNDDERMVCRQAYAGLIWSKQFYHYVVKDWLDGDAEQPPPPEDRKHGRNKDWPHLFNRDILSMPDKWEYPWFAAWDLAFHMIPFARIDPDFAKEQLELLLREWYMHPSGQIPAYEYCFSDVNPPVHAWACWRVYKMTGPRGGRDTLFLKRVFTKLLLNFTWWVNRKDVEGNHIFAGGFLGLDNIGVFDRSRPLPGGGRLEQADGTAWMAFYCATMLSMALELAREDSSFEDIASKFFEHFVAIADSMNTLGGDGLWNDEDGFYYDQLHIDGESVPLRIRSIVGVIPLFAVEVLEDSDIDDLPGFKKRMRWFLENRRDLARQVSYMSTDCPDRVAHARRLLAIPSRERLERVLRYVLDETEFLSDHGVRSLSKAHGERPFVLDCHGEMHSVAYLPGESDSAFFGGNSNWRGPVWFPINYLLVEALERYHHFYADSLKVECPVGSGRLMNLREVARELAGRLVRLFLPSEEGKRACFGADARYRRDPHWRDLLLFHEYFHGETGEGLGASHQTGWTALVVRLIEGLHRRV